MHKTSLCTPTDSTAFMSCVSTPHSRSQDKRNYFKKIQRSELEKSKHNARQFLVSTEEGKTEGEGTVEMKFIFNKKIVLHKDFQLTYTLEQIKKDVIS